MTEIRWTVRSLIGIIVRDLPLRRRTGTALLCRPPPYPSLTGRALNGGSGCRIRPSA